MSATGKKRPEQHRIDTEGLKLFEAALPNNEVASFLFSPEPHDYGIDGGVQVIIDETHTGEFFKVQIKSKSKVRYIKQGKLISLSLDIKSAYFLVNQATSPTALIVVGVEEKKVFWHPIQTDRETRNQIEDNPGQKFITVHVDTTKVLTPDSYEDFYNYFKDANEKLSQKALLHTKTNKTLGTGMKFLSEITERTLELDGFTPYLRSANHPMTQGAVFSMGYGRGRAVDYVPSKDYRTELAPKIKLTAKFSMKTKEGRAKAEAFKKLIEQGKGEIELTDENIDVFEAVSGEKILDDKMYIKGGMKLSLKPALQKQRVTIFIGDEREELKNEVETWLEDGLVHIESIDSQPLYVNTAISIEDGVKTSFQIRINGDLLNNISQELRYMEFLRGLKQMDINVLDPDGFKLKMFSGDFNGEKVITNDRYQFVKALAEIEAATGVVIPYPLPEKITREDIDNVFWIHRLINQGRMTQDITFKFALTEKPDDLNEGGVISIAQSPPEIYLFGKPYSMPNYTQTIRGIITSLESSEGKGGQKYKARVKEAEIILERKLASS